MLEAARIAEELHIAVVGARHTLEELESRIAAEEVLHTVVVEVHRIPEVLESRIVEMLRIAGVGERHIVPEAAHHMLVVEVDIDLAEVRRIVAVVGGIGQEEVPRIAVAEEDIAGMEVEESLRTG
jgi:hypothetical protein